MIDHTQTSRTTTSGIQSRVVEDQLPGKILIVEDDEDLAQLLQYSLKQEFREVLIADNGLSGLAAAESLRPDVVLLDIMMPEIDGWEVCRRLRSHQDRDLASTPVIVLTALGDEEDKFKGLELGADLFVKKPYSLREVSLLCRNFVLNRHRQEHLRDEARKGAESAKSGIYQLLFHELRTQVVVIGSLSHRLCNSGSILTGKEKVYAETIKKSSNYLEKLSDDVGLLELLSNRTCQLPQERFPVGELIGEVADLLQPLMGKKEISLTTGFQPPEMVLTLNRKALQVIVSTFLENSIKYCLNGSRIDIRGRIAGGQIILEFQDNGPGIAEKDQSEIFNKYYRGTVMQSGESGSGLGLFFARSLTEALGGKITVASKPGDGTTFILHFATSVPEISELNEAAEVHRDGGKTNG